MNSQEVERYWTSGNSIQIILQVMADEYVCLDMLEEFIQKGQKDEADYELMKLREHLCYALKHGRILNIN